VGEGGLIAGVWGLGPVGLGEGVGEGVRCGDWGSAANMAPPTAPPGGPQVFGAPPWPLPAPRRPSFSSHQISTGARRAFGAKGRAGAGPRGSGVGAGTPERPGTRPARSRGRRGRRGGQRAARCAARCAAYAGGPRRSRGTGGARRAPGRSRHRDPARRPRCADGLAKPAAPLSSSGGTSSGGGATMDLHHKLRRDPSWDPRGCNLCGQASPGGTGGRGARWPGGRQQAGGARQRPGLRADFAPRMHRRCRRPLSHPPSPGRPHGGDVSQRHRQLEADLRRGGLPAEGAHLRERPARAARRQGV
jgi:hypothetical protein